MTVTIPKDLEPFIEQKVRAGQFPDASAVVSEAVRQFSEQQRDWNEDSSELKAFLLAAVRGGHRPLQLGDLEEMERRILAEDKARCR
jgi:putative addiction module CopG family antidote